MSTMPPTPAAPLTCAERKTLDAIFDVPASSPMHHDATCTVCVPVVTAPAVVAPSSFVAVVTTPCYCDSAYHPAGHAA